ncbi:MAG: cob(I)yrinic acid a,c-diamide adenosyltransferase [Patescibacteria group bacterium]
MLYTRKGDNGKTGTFGCNQKISKSSNITEALGCLDEINSYMGVVKSRVTSYKVLNENAEDIINRVQNNLFIIQAQVAGADKNILENEVKNVEEIINNIEKELPPIKSFLISGMNDISASFDFARTVARRAERRVVGVHEEGIAKIDTETLVYLNRLSSLLYALARYAANEEGVEVAPKY